MQGKQSTCKHFLKYSAGSVVSSVAEEGLFLLFTVLLNDVLSGFALTLLPLMVARLASGLIQFYFNRILVFHQQSAVTKALLRYFLQAIPLAVLQMLGTYGVYNLFDIGSEQVLVRGGVYAAVMLVLFVVSFLIQKCWVFSSEEKGV